MRTRHAIAARTTASTCSFRLGEARFPPVRKAVAGDAASEAKRG